MCKDRRFYIKRNITGEHSTPTAEIQCQWSGNYNLNPMNFICEVKFCVNFTSAPADKNFNYTWDIKKLGRAHEDQIKPRTFEFLQNIFLQ